MVSLESRCWDYNIEFGGVVIERNNDSEELKMVWIIGLDRYVGSSIGLEVMRCMYKFDEWIYKKRKKEKNEKM